MELDDGSTGNHRVFKESTGRSRIRWRGAAPPSGLMAGGRKPSGNEGMVREGPRTLESSGGLSAVPGWVAGCAGLRGPGRQRLRPAEWLGRFVCLCAAAHPQAARVGVASQPAASWGTGGRISRSNKVEDRSVGGGLRVWSLLRINKNESRRLGYDPNDFRARVGRRCPPWRRRGDGSPSGHPALVPRSLYPFEGGPLAGLTFGRLDPGRPTIVGRRVLLQLLNTQLLNTTHRSTP